MVVPVLPGSQVDALVVLFCDVEAQDLREEPPRPLDVRHPYLRVPQMRNRHDNLTSRSPMPLSAPYRHDRSAPEALQGRVRYCRTAWLTGGERAGSIGCVSCMW